MAKPREIPGIGAGLNLDALPDDLPPGMWSDARNMRFKNGEARSFGGIQKVFGDLPGAAEPRYIAAYQTTDDKRYFIVVAGGRVYALGGALPGPADITPTG